MAKPASNHTDAAVAEHAHEPIDSSVYLRIFAVLAVVTAIEVAASFLNRIGLPEFIQIIVLLILGTIKGALVVLFFMHLKFDSRWFSTMFVLGMVIAALLMIVFIVLFGYKAGLAG